MNTPPASPGSSPASSSATGTQSTGAHAPNIPKLGGSIGTAVWIGGPPNVAFDGPALTGPATPLCFRNLDTSSEIKGFIKRTEGLSTKFKRSDPDFTLTAFADEALAHMQRCGMDTIFYMTGMKPDGTGAKDLFSFHTRFSNQEVFDHVTKMITDGAFDALQLAALK